MGNVIKRTTLMVRDMDRALEFYRDVLGFDVVFIKDSDPNSYSYGVFEIERGSAMRFCVLRTDDQPNVMALTEVPGLPPATPRRAGIVLGAGNIDEGVAAARARPDGLPRRSSGDQGRPRRY